MALWRSISSPLPRPRPTECTKAKTTSPASFTSVGSHVKVSHTSWTSATKRRMPSWPEYTSGLKTRSDMSRRKSDAHRAASASASPRFNASWARRTMSVLADTSDGVADRRAGRVAVLVRAHSCRAYPATDAVQRGTVACLAPDSPRCPHPAPNEPTSSSRKTTLQGQSRRARKRRRSPLVQGGRLGDVLDAPAIRRGRRTNAGSQLVEEREFGLVIVRHDLSCHW